MSDINVREQLPQSPVSFVKLLCWFAAAKWEQEQSRLRAAEQIAGSIAGDAIEINLVEGV